MVAFIYLCFYCSCPWSQIHTKQKITKTNIKDITTCFLLGFYGFRDFLKYILLIMLLQLTHFFSPLNPPPPSTPIPSSIPPLSSFPWVVHINSLASTFPILFFPSPCLFSTYHWCYLFSVPFHLSPRPTPLLITLHVISISVVLFLF